MDVGRCFVLVYIGESEWQFFKSQNLYLGVANLTDSVEHAAMMSLDDAEKKWDCMTVKDDWQIWSVRPGIVLDAMSNRHIIRMKKEALEAELKSLPKYT